MRKTKFTLFSLAVFAGIGSAYASTHQTKNSFAGTTYYAYSTGGGHFCWTTTWPGFFGWTCQIGIPYCTIITRGGANPYSPICDVIPTASQATPDSSTHRVYRE